MTAVVIVIRRKLAFVFLHQMFNEHTGIAIVSPITDLTTGMNLDIVLSEERSTQGAILIQPRHFLDDFDGQAPFLETPA